MKKLKICLVGANGRMGQEIAKLLAESKTLSAAIAIVRKGRAPGFKRSFTDISEVKAGEVDIVIDFSSPKLMQKSLKFCVAHKVPLVCGITGLASADTRALILAAKKTAILYAPNMSLGVAILKASLALLSELKGFDFQIIESHHRYKKDSPSGTAKDLQHELEIVTGRSWPAPLALRVGGVVGEHEVIAASADEIIRFKHEALDRRVFASGALRAAEYISRQKKGMFKMEDVLQLNRVKR